MVPRAGLDRGVVVRAAADLVNAEGVEALSLKRLSETLGVRTSSLYNHIDGLPGLRRDLALLNARQLGDRLVNAAVGRSHGEAVLAIAQAYRRYIKENPGLYMATLQASGMLEQPEANGAGNKGAKVFVSANNRASAKGHAGAVDHATADLRAAEDRVVQVALAVMASFGLKGEDGLHAVRGFRSLVHGFATLEISGGFGLPLSRDESFLRLLEMFITALKRSAKNNPA
jgi:AcrR family transcriptional regulator